VRASEVQGELPASEARWLLIGNSRWHWAVPPLAADSPLRVWHDRPWHGDRSEREGKGTGAPVSATSAADEDGIPPRVASALLLGWAAVGPVSADLVLPPGARVQLAEVPLQAAPPWLGIDRALAGWWGWRLVTGPVLVADAGTVLSFTRVDWEGRFAGGRLLAGAALQLRAMAGGTAHLPALDAPAVPVEASAVAALAEDAVPADPAPAAWPHDTAGAMRSGVLRGLAAAIAAAIQETRREEPDCRLLLTGGDGPALAALLEPALAVEQRPHLCLEALAALRPARDQPSPRSLRI
jgi:type III pantothenate kinase